MSLLNSCKTRRDPPIERPAVYLPAMWPLSLQNLIADTWAAWRWRQRLRRLLQQEARGEARLGDAQAAVQQGAQERLSVIAARFAERRRQCQD